MQFVAAKYEPSRIFGIDDAEHANFTGDFRLNSIAVNREVFMVWRW